ncbi:hypothetical protein [Dactylosporangium cerinum]
MADNDPAADHLGVDVDAVQSLAAFARACARLRAGRSYAKLSLPAATLSDLLNAKGTPTRDTLIKFLIACGLNDATAQAPWLAAWERVATAHLPRPDGAVRVRDARPRLLGVHAAIQVEDAEGELPPYVPRDLDADLRTAVTAATASGGLVLMVGGSSVGKTRALFEAVRAALPEWWLLHPADIPAIGAHAAAPTPRTVLWLDELQRYLNHPAGLTLGVLHRLITAGTVIVATLWPDEYSRRTARPAAGQPDPHAEDRETLRLAHVVRVPDRFTTAERRRGEILANTDRRLRIALDTTDAGFTQVLAAGPALIQRWETAEHCYGQAVITAALDARRVGAQHPVTREYLTAAAPAYLTPTQQATAPPDWLEQALTYATTPVHGATGCLTPAPAGMGSIAGYTTADYLHQHSQRAHRTTTLPDSAWHALTTHHHPDDTLGLADSAYRRGQPTHAFTFYGRADADNERAAYRLADLLAEQGRLQELHARADAGNEPAADRLAYLLAKQGRVEDALQLLRTRADSGNEHAAYRLADLLAEQGRLQELHARADAGNEPAADRLAYLLAKQGRVEELRAGADAGSEHAANWLAYLLAEQGPVEDALQLLRTRADSGNEHAAYRLADLLAEQGRLEELRARADADANNEHAADRLAYLLAKQGRVEELRARADAGNEDAAQQLAYLLAKQGRVEELRTRADAGNEDAAYQLADRLAKQGSVGDALQLLRTRADAGNEDAAYLLADLLAEEGRLDELRARADADNEHAADRLADLLTRQGRVEDALQLLRTRADAGNENAARSLVWLLASGECIDELRDEVAAGTSGAAQALHGLLHYQPRDALLPLT